MDTPTSSLTAPQACEDEDSLWRRYCAGQDTDACHRRLVEAYLPLVARLVERACIRSRGRLDRNDLVNAGVLGLHDAITHFQARRQTPFAAFASKRIRGAVCDELRRIDPLTRTQRRLYHRICETIAKLQEQWQMPPSKEQIATAMGLPVATVDSSLAMGAGTVSLQDPTGESSDLLDTLPDSRAVSPRDAADHTFSHEALRRCFRRLPERDQQLLYLRLYEDLRVSEIAQVLGISEGRVSQCYLEIVAKLRVLMLADTNQPARPRP